MYSAYRSTPSGPLQEPDALPQELAAPGLHLPDVSQPEALIASQLADACSAGMFPGLEYDDLPIQAPDQGPDWLDYYQQDNAPAYPESWQGQDGMDATRRQRHLSLLDYGWEQAEW